MDRAVAVWVRNGQPVTRFAPSPTGHLHLGHAAHLLYVWGCAELVGATVLVRIEDHDKQRCQAHYEASILEDLEWLGFLGSSRTGPLTRQSYRQFQYSDAVDRLVLGARVYRCRCSRRILASLPRSATTGETIYPGRCRDADHGGDQPHGLRVAWNPDTPPERFDDGLLGPQEQRPETQCGDLLIRDRNGNWTYQFSASADDARQDVDLVVRGEDLLASTGRQIRLLRLLGRSTFPQYLHHPLIVDESGSKLSKACGAPALRTLRDRGVSAHSVLGMAAKGVGMVEHVERVSHRDAGALVAERHPDLADRLAGTVA